jgi:hypothetical protein
MFISSLICITDTLFCGKTHLVPPPPCPHSFWTGQRKVLEEHIVDFCSFMEGLATIALHVQCRMHVSIMTSFGGSVCLATQV